MVISLRSAALVYRVVSFGLIATGIIRLGGLISGEPVWSTFLFYTTQSNLLCLAWMGLLAGFTVRDIVTRGTRGVTAPAPRLSAAVMMAITVTMIIYLVLLAPTAFEQSGGEYAPFGLTDNLVHIITPCLLIADWLLFTPKGRLRGYDPLLWTIPCYAYLTFAFTHAALGGDFGGDRAYPYPFMDVEVHGVGGVALWILGLTVALVGVGYLYLLLDRALARAGERRTDTHASAKTVPSPPIDAPSSSAGMGIGAHEGSAACHDNPSNRGSDHE